MKECQIVEHGVVVGRFRDELDRNYAFQKHFMDKGRMAYKKEEEIDILKRGGKWSSMKKNG